LTQKDPNQSVKEPVLPDVPKVEETKQEDEESGGEESEDEDDGGEESEE
jgi:hypothetical protein